LLAGQLDQICRNQHFRGNESHNDLLRAKVIIKDDKESVNILQSKTCPNCREQKPDAYLCFKCGFIMSFQAFQKDKEEREKKDQAISELKEQMNKMQQVTESNYKSYDDLVKVLVYVPFFTDLCET